MYTERHPRVKVKVRVKVRREVTVRTLENHNDLVFILFSTLQFGCERSVVELSLGNGGRFPRLLDLKKRHDKRNTPI